MTQIVPTGWGNPKGSAAIDLPSGRLMPHMGARAYFAGACTAGTYNNTQYMALNLLGRSLTFTADLRGAGCGCNAALYLVSMRQNRQPSTCHDYYCDANKVCGVSCAEIDIMEANMFSWHTTLHTAHDHNGVGSGYGGGDGYNGPRDWTGPQYSPRSSCIDTTLPFQVAASFPVDGQGKMSALEVKLTQAGRSCSVSARVDGYAGFGELTAALSMGMTPVVSYWSSDEMLWMDGKGSDGQGPCERDNAKACADSVKFYDFSIQPITGEGAYPGGAPSTTQPLFFAGQGPDGRAPSTTMDPRKVRGGHKLLMEVADKIEKSVEAHTTTSKITFDCHSGVSNWQYGWSDMKKAACCKVVNIPCPAGVTTSPAAPAHSGCVSAYQQCGGQNWQGATCCEDGCDCRSHGDFYSQCTPNGPRGTCAANTGGELTFIRKDDSDERMDVGPSAPAASSGSLWQRLDILNGISLLALGMSVCMLASLVSRCRAPRPTQGTPTRTRRYESLASVPLRLPEAKEASGVVEESSPFPIMQASSPSPMLEASSPSPMLEASSPAPSRLAASPEPPITASPCSTLAGGLGVEELREACSPCPTASADLPGPAEPSSPSPRSAARSP